MYQRMFDDIGADITIDTVPVKAGAPIPDPATLEAVIIPGSSAGVYDDFEWMDPLRDFARHAYAAGLPMVGICFGHQLIADALGGDVRKSDKGWGIGRHVYSVVEKPGFMSGAPQSLAVSCSHQDQVLAPPAEAEVILSSDFTPNAGLIYKNGRVLSMQPHPEFYDDYMVALAEARRGPIAEDIVDAAVQSMSIPSQQNDTARYITAFLKGA